MSAGVSLKTGPHHRRAFRQWSHCSLGAVRVAVRGGRRGRGPQPARAATPKQLFTLQLSIIPRHGTAWLPSHRCPLPGPVRFGCCAVLHHYHSAAAPAGPPDPAPLPRARQRAAPQRCSVCPTQPCRQRLPARRHGVPPRGNGPPHRPSLHVHVAVDPRGRCPAFDAVHCTSPSSPVLAPPTTRSYRVLLHSAWPLIIPLSRSSRAW